MISDTDRAACVVPSGTARSFSGRAVGAARVVVVVVRRRRRVVRRGRRLRGWWKERMCILVGVVVVVVVLLGKEKMGGAPGFVVGVKIPGMRFWGWVGRMVGGYLWIV
jgi:hypothetical protein